jgi:hypothetical protein
MTMERSGQAIRVRTLKGQLVTGGTRGLTEGGSSPWMARADESRGSSPDL